MQGFSSYVYLRSKFKITRFIQIEYWVVIKIIPIIDLILSYEKKGISLKDFFLHLDVYGICDVKIYIISRQFDQPNIRRKRTRKNQKGV
jgi:hypothetical protein